MVELKNFTKKYNGFLAADNISCSFEKNLITGILGPNGAGKTTILKAISGRHFPTDGHIFIDSQKYGKIESCDEPAKVRNITGFVEELPQLPEDYTVKEYLCEVCDLHSADKKNVFEAETLFSLDEVFLTKF